MKTVIAVLLLVSLSAAAYAGALVRDDNSQTVQGAAYHGGKAQALTIVSTVVDMRGDAAYSVYCASTAYERALPAANTDKAGYVKTPVPATTWSGGYVNPNTPFFNISGCVGYIKRQ